MAVSGTFNAGAARKTIVIEQRVTQPDSAGEPMFAWVNVATRAATVERGAGTERWIGKERAARGPTVFIIRYPRQVKVLPQMRLKCDGVLYDIKSASDPDGYKAVLVLACEELTNEPII